MRHVRRERRDGADDEDGVDETVLQREDARREACDYEQRQLQWQRDQHEHDDGRSQRAR